MNLAGSFLNFIGFPTFYTTHVLGPLLDVKRLPLKRSSASMEKT
jgi:hypothetical protein